MKSTVFNAYAKYYDLLYREKRYDEETDFVSGIIKKISPAASSVLDFGCGTGKHCECFSLGFEQVAGVDMSQDMIDIAYQKHKDIDFYCGNTTDIKLGRKFDAVVSLFHVMSYQITNENLLATIKNAECHLNDKGLFVFDCWYGPGVITTKPEARIKRLEDEQVYIIRLAEPILYPNENRVDVQYTVLVKDKNNDQIEMINETHQMRYLFVPEIEFMLKTAGLSLIDCQEWMTGRTPDFNSWTALFVAQKI